MFPINMAIYWVFPIYIYILYIVYTSPRLPPSASSSVASDTFFKAQSAVDASRARPAFDICNLSALRHLMKTPCHAGMMFSLKWGNHQQYLHCLVFVALSSVANPECSQM